MNPKATRNLCQLRDDDFFATISEGIDLLVEHVTRLSAGARLLVDGGEPRGARVLEAVMSEEAAKVLILLDAVRCPRQPAKRLSDHLAKFHSHLAKGIYAKACYWRAWTLGQLRSYIDHDRETLYLDGPNDVDFIMRNHVLQEREDALYVSYCESGDQRWWASPRIHDEGLMPRIEPMVVQIAKALHSVGIAAEGALRVVAEVWRPFTLEEDTPSSAVWERARLTLEELQRVGLLKEQPVESYQLILGQWAFPLYSIDMRPIEVERKGLQEIQAGWEPDW